MKPLPQIKELIVGDLLVICLPMYIEELKISAHDLPFDITIKYERNKMIVLWMVKKQRLMAMISQNGTEIEMSMVFPFTLKFTLFAPCKSCTSCIIILRQFALCSANLKT